MDMGRTAVNVMGNCISTAVVARWEGVFDDGSNDHAQFSSGCKLPRQSEPVCLHLESNYNNRIQLL
jgi:hypothetical protein